MQSLSSILKDVRHLDFDSSRMEALRNFITADGPSVTLTELLQMMRVFDFDSSRTKALDTVRYCRKLKDPLTARDVGSVLERLDFDSSRLQALRSLAAWGELLDEAERSRAVRSASSWLDFDSTRTGAMQVIRGMRASAVWRAAADAASHASSAPCATAPSAAASSTGGVASSAAVSSSVSSSWPFLHQASGRSELKWVSVYSSGSASSSSSSAAQVSVASRPEPFDDVPCRADTGDKACVICLESRVATVIVDCGHSVLCGQCSRDDKLTVCPVCRKKIGKVIRVYS